MKNILVISSATKKAYICLKAGERESFCEIDANCKQSENILVEIDKLLNGANLEIKDIDDVGVVVGPGSFTGVRIGVALVKGFCAGNKNIKVCPISSLDLMAKHISIVEPFACGINALSGLVFVKTFGEKTYERESLVSMEEFNTLSLPKFGLEEENICENKITLSPKSLLSLALEQMNEGKFVDPFVLSPVYLRNSQAEENLKKIKKTSEIC